jgi:hypothetical protein
VLMGHVKRVELWLLGAFVVGIILVFAIDWTAKHELHLDEKAEDSVNGKEKA